MNNAQWTMADPTTRATWLAEVMLRELFRRANEPLGQGFYVKVLSTAWVEERDGAREVLLRYEASQWNKGPVLGVHNVPISAEVLQRTSLFVIPTAHLLHKMVCDAEDGIKVMMDEMEATFEAGVSGKQVR